MKYSIFRSSDRKKMAMVIAGIAAGILILGTTGSVVLKPKAEEMAILFSDFWSKSSWIFEKIFKGIGVFALFFIEVMLRKKYGK